MTRIFVSFMLAMLVGIFLGCQSGPAKKTALQVQQAQQSDIKLTAHDASADAACRH